MYPTRKEYLGTISNPGNNQRAKLPLVNGVRTKAIIFRLRATVVVSVADTTNVRNMGSIAGCFSEMGLLEGSAERWNLTGMHARFLSEMISPQPLAAVRAANVQGTYNLEEIVTLPMALPWALNQEETFFIEKDTKLSLSAFVTPNFTSGQLFTIGGATVVISAIAVDVFQVYDQERARGCIFIPTARIIPKTITAAAPGANAEIPIDTEKYVRGLVVLQSTNVGVVNDAINTLTFRGARRMLIGPEAVPWRLLTRSQELEFGGRVTGGGFGNAPLGDFALGMMFQDGGRLSNVLNPAFDTNWRIIANAQVSAATGATTTEILVAILELEEEPGITRPDKSFRV